MDRTPRVVFSLLTVLCVITVAVYGCRDSGRTETRDGGISVEVPCDDGRNGNEQNRDTRIDGGEEPRKLPKLVLAGFGENPQKHESFGDINHPVHPRVESVFALLCARKAAHPDDHAGFQSLAESRGVKANRFDVEVQIHVPGTQGTESVPYGPLESLGLRETIRSRNFIDGFAPVHALEGIAESFPAIKSIRPLRRRRPRAVTSEGVSRTGASGWKSRGLDGSGVKVAVLDSDFVWAAEAAARGELPSNVTTKA